MSFSPPPQQRRSGDVTFTPAIIGTGPFVPPGLMEEPMRLLIRDRKQEVLVAVVLIKTATSVRLNSTIRTSDFVVQHSVLEGFLFSYQP